MKLTAPIFRTNLISVVGSFQMLRNSGELHCTALRTLHLTGLYTTRTGWARSHRTPRRYTPQTQYKFTQHSAARSTI